MYGERGDLESAEAVYAETIVEAQLSGYSVGLLWARYGYGRLRETQGALEEAARLYHAALAYARERNLLHVPAARPIFAGLGRLSYHRNHLPAALAYLEEGLGPNPQLSKVGGRGCRRDFMGVL